MITRDLNSLLRRLIQKETMFLRHYIGKVLNNQDPLKKGRVCCAVYELGVDSEANGFWAHARDKLSMVVPAVGDWVEIYFINGDRNRPVYMGGADEMSTMTPINFTGNPRQAILYEDRDNKIHLKYDADLNELDIGNASFQPAARKGDSVKVTIPAGSLPATAGPYPVVVSAPIDVTGTITEGSGQVKIGDSK